MNPNESKISAENEICDEAPAKTLESVDEKTSFYAKIVNKIKKIKHFEIVCALVIASIAIVIYFGVNTFSTKTPDIKKDNVETIVKGDELSTQIASILTNMQGVGHCQVLITYDDSNKNVVKGIVVVADGGDDIYTKFTIIDAVCALVKVDAQKIKVYKMN